MRVNASTTQPNVRRGGDTPSLAWERKAWVAGKLLVAGVDEVGRGAWAGPLTAAAVLVPADPRRVRDSPGRSIRWMLLPRDSKLMSPQQRERVCDVLVALGVPCAIVDIPPQEIDALGLGVANRLAMCRAAAALEPLPQHVLVDAFPLADLHCSHDAIVRGDATCVSIALASIVAKVHRDALMTDVGRLSSGLWLCGAQRLWDRRTCHCAGTTGRHAVTSHVVRTHRGRAARWLTTANVTGDAGEAYVAGRLEREGYTILERNWRVRGGEIDIIALGWRRTGVHRGAGPGRSGWRGGRLG